MSRSAHRRYLRLAAAAAAAVLAVTVVGQQPAAAEPPRPRTLSAQQVPATFGKPVVAKPRPKDLSQGAGSPKIQPVAWPASGTAEAALPRRGAPRQRVGTLPVLVAGPTHPLSPIVTGALTAVARVRVTLRARTELPAGWRNGLVLEVARADGAATDGRVSISVDYGAFEHAYGADWSSRLRLLALPACALTTPAAPDCRPTALPSRNDTRKLMVTADVKLGTSPSLLALTGGASGAAGDFGASSLQASSTWTAGGNAGSFSWSYPIRVPPSLGGAVPQVALEYSSSMVDGRSEATNNQPSWVGEGFDYWPGYIERRYKRCADDTGGGANNPPNTGDLCWGTDNATMSLGGRGGELIKDGTTGVWRLKSDDASKVEHLNGSTPAIVNGDNDNEYWKITTSDGTQYFFGRNRLPGYTGTAPADKTTNSAWTVAVAGNNSGEPCHQSGYVASFCAQAWRWNLDYVVDTHGNTLSLFYVTETNKYARNNTDTDMVSYNRAGWLDHIDYGTDNRSGTDTENTATAAPMRVQIGVGDRCLSSCWSGSDPNPANWTDTPWDQYCKPSATSCPGLYSPTFFTAKRLASLTTKVREGAAYKDVDAWTLSHTYPDPGDGTRAGLWLESLVHTGKATGDLVVGGNITLPEINFDFVQMANRVDTDTDGKPPMNWMRIATIWTETGGKIDVRYTGVQCVPGVTMPASPQTNTLRCYPVRTKKPDGSIETQYFHKYLVTTVTEADRTGGGPDVNTNYEYVGTPAWRHTDDDGITADNLRTWSDYRGYSQVNTRVGDLGSGNETLNQSTFFRGMHGDLDGSGGTRTVVLPALDVNGDGITDPVGQPGDARAVNDENAYSGMVRATTLYNGVTSAPVSSTANEPWQSPPTATRDMGVTTVYARYTAVMTTWAATKLATGPWRVTRSDTSFDNAYGMVTQSDDRGDLSVSGDEACSVTSYNRNQTSNLVNLASRVDRYAIGCAAVPSPGPTSEADIVSMSRSFYDHQGFTTPPTKGEVTQIDVAKSWTPAGGPVWLTKSTATCDAYGRPTDVADVRGNHITTIYTPATGGPVTSVASTTVLGTTTSTVEPSWGKSMVGVDVNGKRTEQTVDALGRTTAVWLANHLKASFPSQPSSSYAYLVRNSGGVNAVTTNKLNPAGNYVTSYSLLDGLLRSRQTQALSMANNHLGTVFSETKYDPLGRTVSQSEHFDPLVQPSTTLFTIADWQPKTQTVTEYDRVGRPTASIVRSTGSELWRTSTAYGGDRVSVLPPTGGGVIMTVSDAHGRTVQERLYHNPADLGSETRSLYDLVTYHFNRKGERDAVTDNAGNTWTFGFDLSGRRTAIHDPDKGDTTSVYNDAGDLISTTDARPLTMAYSYDTIGRKTGLYAGSVAPANKLATWVWDPTGFKGQLSYASRWLNSGVDEYRVKVRSYTALYQPTGVDHVIPAVAAMTGLSGTYTTTNTFKVDGSPATMTYPGGGGLGTETVTYTYDATTGLPEQLLTNAPGLSQYVANTDYTAYGELSFVEYRLLAGNFLQRSFTYDDATHRLSRATTIRQISPQPVDDLQYKYNEAGTIIRVEQTPASGSVDIQCFEHDYARRLVDAWTPSSGNCADAKSAGSLGGPAPYWQSWSFDAASNRAGQTTHATGGDTTASYTYPAAGAARPHAPTSVLTVGPGVNRTDNYGYDNTGNTTCRPAGTTGNTCPAGAGSQTLTWDQEGRLAQNSQTGSTTTYTYTADGERLVLSDPSATTLYLPNMEISRNKSTGVVTARRYYSWGGTICAMLATGGAVTWLVPDHQGTQQITVAAGNQTISQRRQTPYGSPRGSNPSWPNPKGFVNGDNDTATGLTHLGAREYDPGLGRFISVDPLLNVADPQQMQGYAYANSNPISLADPTGLDPCPQRTGGGGGCYYDGSTGSRDGVYPCLGQRTTVCVPQRHQGSASDSLKKPTRPAIPSSPKTGWYPGRGGEPGDKLPKFAGREADYVIIEYQSKFRYTPDMFKWKKVGAMPDDQLKAEIVRGNSGMSITCQKLTGLEFLGCQPMASSETEHQLVEFDRNRIGSNRRRDDVTYTIGTLVTRNGDIYRFVGTSRPQQDEATISMRWGYLETSHTPTAEEVSSFVKGFVGTVTTTWPPGIQAGAAYSWPSLEKAAWEHGYSNSTPGISVSVSYTAVDPFAKLPGLPDEPVSAPCVFCGP